MATGDEDGIILIRDPETGERQFELTVERGEALSLTFVPGTSWLVASTNYGDLFLFDVEARTLNTTWHAHSNQIWRVIASPDGRLLITAGGDGFIRLWDASTTERAAQVTGHGAAIRDVAISADGATLASGGDDWRVFVWRIAPVQ
jgi:WD40 repeat protein